VSDDQGFEKEPSLADERMEPLTYCKVALLKDHTLRFETPEDEVVGRGLIDALRAHFDQKMQQKRMAAMMEAANVRAMVDQITKPASNTLTPGFPRRIR